MSGKIPTRHLYEQVLKADGELQSIAKSIPKYVHQSNGYEPYLDWQRRTFLKSVAHKVSKFEWKENMLINAWSMDLDDSPKFALGKLERQMVYVYTTARTTLEELHLSIKEEKYRDMWTVCAHVVSASIILLLNMILSEGDRRDLAFNRKLVCDCLAGLAKSEQFSSISQRGVGLIEILLDHEQKCTPQNRGHLDIRYITDKLQINESAVPMVAEDAQLMAMFDSQNRENLMQSFERTFDA